MYCTKFIIERFKYFKDCFLIESNERIKTITGDNIFASSDRYDSQLENLFYGVKVILVKHKNQKHQHIII
ncbi:hypothetical protein B9Q28_17690 [Enterobacter cloacae]|nr:hypothetical protein B9Q28_17690 [Enterobacter cloacae]